MVRTRVGYTGGTLEDPTYHHLGDHTEALQVDFDPELVSYAELLERVWRGHDPTRPAFSRQYRAAIWYADEHQRLLAEGRAQRAAAQLGAPIATAIEPLGRFYRAEDYHQKYRLRRERALTDELCERYGGDRAMVDATATARINGFLGGHRPRRELQAILPQLALSSQAERVLLARVNG